MSDDNPSEKVEVDPEVLGQLAFCAISYNRRMPNGQVPTRIWHRIPQEWRDRIKSNDTDPRWERRNPS